MSVSKMQGVKNLGPFRTFCPSIKISGGVGKMSGLKIKLHLWQNLWYFIVRNEYY